MARIEIASPTDSMAVARSFIYRSLSVCFSHPARTIYPAFQSGRFMRELWNKLSLIPYMADFLPNRFESTRRVAEECSRLSFEDFEARHVNAFGSGRDESPLSLHESRHLKDHKARTTQIENIQAFYERFDLSMRNRGDASECADHLSVELEFVHFLTLREFQAGSREQGPDASHYLSAQKEFMELHLLNWVPGCVAKLEQAASVPVLYVETGRIAAEYLGRDIEWITRQLDDSHLLAGITRWESVRFHESTG